MDFAIATSIVAQCEFEDYTLALKIDGRGCWYLQASYEEPDVATYVRERQYTRRWYVSPEMTRSELVQTVFKCCLTSMEHRTREWFRYRGRAVFGPHFDVEALWEICDRQERRE